MTQTTRFPMDYDTLQKGDLISVDQVEQIVNLKRDHKDFPFKLMALKSRIETDLWHGGRTWTLKLEGQSIRVLKDNEASDYNDRQIDHHVQGMRRRHTLQVGVDVSQLSSDEQHRHERRVIVASKMIQAVKTARKEALAIPHQRTTPKMIGVE